MAASYMLVKIKKHTKLIRWRRETGIVARFRRERAAAGRSGAAASRSAAACGGGAYDNDNYF
jgi:hypothetical protein